MPTSFAPLAGQPLGSRTLAAAGSTQGTATQIPSESAEFYLVTGADAAKGVKLPEGTPGKFVVIKNDETANAVLKVYPYTGDGINAIAVNSAFSMPAKSEATFTCYDGTTWFTGIDNSSATNALTSAHLFVGNGSNIPTDVAASGDVSLANTGAFTVTGVNGSATARTGAQINLLSAGVAAGYKVARGEHTQVAASDTVVTGLATVVAVVVSPRTRTVKQLFFNASPGDQAGTPAAGSILITSQKPTAVNDVTPTAATDFTDSIVVDWIAVGT